ncbi:syntaxin-5 [Trichogramma pretiosum]|uniref:syntaxin-5 n=1 Tax=Trichogramma pretiosum TaxID=7493 RepID=UPI0006C9AA95|nr:syntaxin-5 [Trichogramma pretiosum]
MSARRRRIGSHEYSNSSSNQQFNNSNSSNNLQQTGYFLGAHDNAPVPLTASRSNPGLANGAGAQDEALQPTRMTSRDRTHEFGHAVRSLQSSTAQAVAASIRQSSAVPRQAKYLQDYNNFMQFAKGIGKNVVSTCAKLEKLTLLAKKKSIFDDRQMEIEELTTIIKTDLSSLNQQIAKLQDFNRKQRENFESAKGHHIASHSSSVVVVLQSKLANMSNNFKNLLEIRSEKMREEQSRREQFSHGHISTMMPPSAVAGQQGSLLLQEQDSGASVSIDLEPAMGQLSLQRAVYDDTDSYIQARAETMQNIESTIVELGGIFQQLAHMIKEQEEMVERIDSNVEVTELNVAAGHTEILKYFRSVSRNRGLMIKIFAFLIFFLVFFVVFLA